MQTVFVFSTNANELKSFCKSAFGRHLCGKDEFFHYKTLDVHIASRALDIHSKKAIIIFLDVDESFEKMQVENGAICIVESGNKNAMSLLARNKCSAIVCGGPHDTISFSSIQNDSIVICQQRCIHTIDGKKIEPCEYIFTPSEDMSIGTALLVAALKTVTQ